MTEEAYAVPLIRTKLQRPRLPADLVPRPRLISKLNRGLDRRLTLISAQAGAGKSTLLAQWLLDIQSQWPSAWLSLDEHDNDLVVFLAYLCEAFRTLFPGACSEALSLLRATEDPPGRVITATLVNEMNALVRADETALNEGSSSSGVILALDDYQYITKPEIHDMVSGLIAYLPHGVHLALASRIDPPLRLWELRARRQITELRTADLRFTGEESHALLQTMLGDGASGEMATLLTEKCEGWIVGLRLAAISVDTLADAEAFIGRFGGTSSAGIVDYLSREVLARQLPEVQDLALRTSILDRFCAPLCEEVSEIPAAKCQEIIEWMSGANLFLIPLDEEGGWYRYHHLFRDLLRHELRQRCSAEEISAMHANSGTWFAQKGWVDEALHYLMTADDVAAAADLVARHRYALMNGTKWQQLHRYLHLFSPDVLDQYPDLLMLKAWLLYHRGRWGELPSALEQLDSTLAKVSLPPTAVDHLQGEISALRSLLLFHANDPENALAAAQLALDKSPRELWIVRVLARLYLAGVLQRGGNSNDAYAAIYRALELEETESSAFKAILVSVACNLYWLDGDLQGMAQAADQGIELAQHADAPHFLNYGHYQRGRVCYQQDDLAQAQEHFAAAARQPYLNYGDAYVNSVCGLALIHQVQGRTDEAQMMLEAASAFFIETGNTTLMPLVRAFQAELALLQGQIATASQWADRLDPIPPLTPIYGFFSPHLTLAKVWQAQDTEASWRKATNLLRQVREYVESTHNTRFLIETLALQALVYDTEGDEPAALEAIERAITLAEPGGFIRVFVDLGPPLSRAAQRMPRLLDKLLRQEQRKGSFASDYVARVVAAFAGETEDRHTDESLAEPFRPVKISDESSPSSMRHRDTAVLHDPLTVRELEVLDGLSRHLTNKEIAEELFVSAGTVKTHTLHIYRKLNVSTRRQAVTRAEELGILA
jgi:LuxR family maltose regulon positive regulatory protein